MKKLHYLVALSLCTLSPFSLAQTQLSSTQQKASYAIGTDLAQNLLNQGIELEVDAFLAGLADTLQQRPLKLSPAEMDTALDAFKTELETKQQAKFASVAKANAERGEAFLQSNLKKPGIKTLESGLQYRIIEAGNGEKPKLTDTVIAHYRGTLIDGTEFDSSYNRGMPIEFKLENVIPGWQQALKLMPIGSKWEVFIPAHLAYGERGAGKVIGPNETLIFEIQLLSIAQP